MERHASMTMTNHYSGRVSGTHITVVRFAIGAIVMIAASLTGPVSAVAQTSDANSPPPSSNSKSQTSAPTTGKKEQVGGPKVITERSLFFPDLAHSRLPLTAGEKFHLAIANSVSPAAFLGSGFSAAMGQAADSPSGYGQGGSGYGKRFGASMANRAGSRDRKSTRLNSSHL